VVVAVTDGRQDGFTLLTRTFGTWEWILSGQAEWLAREPRRPAAEAGVGQNHRGVAAFRAILTSTDVGRYA
jgi:hypothetical protein